MPLTPILRRTFAIFRERPLLFLAMPFLFSAVSELQSALPRGHVTRNALLFLVTYVVLSTVSAAMVTSLTLDQEQGILLTFAQTWMRVRRQPQLIKTAGSALAYFFAICIVTALVAGFFFFIWVILKSIVSGSPHTSHAAVHHSPLALSFGTHIFLWLVDLGYAPIALSIPLLYIKKPSKNDQYHPLGESRRYARAVYWSIVAILIGYSLPGFALFSAGKVIHPTLAGATFSTWAGRLLMASVTACTAALSHITLTLVALNRVAAEPSTEPARNLGLSPTVSPPVILL